METFSFGPFWQKRSWPEEAKEIIWQEVKVGPPSAHSPISKVSLNRTPEEVGGDLKCVDSSIRKYFFFPVIRFFFFFSHCYHGFQFMSILFKQ